MSATIPSLDKTTQFKQVVRDNPKTAVLALALLATLVVSSIFLKISYEAQDYLFFIYGGLAITGTVGLITITSTCISTLRKKNDTLRREELRRQLEGGRRLESNRMGTPEDTIAGSSSTHTTSTPSTTPASDTTNQALEAEEAQFVEMQKEAKRIADLILGASSDSTPMPERSTSSSYTISPSKVIGSSTTNSSSASVPVKKTSLPTILLPSTKAEFEALYRQKLSEGQEAFGEWIKALSQNVTSYGENQINILTSTFSDGTTVLFGWAQYFEYVKMETPSTVSSATLPYAFFLRNLVVRMKNLNISDKARTFLEHKNQGLNCITTITNKTLQDKVRLRWQSAINNLEN